MQSMKMQEPEDTSDTNFRDLFKDLNHVTKLALTSVLVANTLVNVCFHWLVIRLAVRNGPLKKNPINWIILIDEAQKFIGLISLTCKEPKQPVAKRRLSKLIALFF